MIGGHSSQRTERTRRTAELEDHLLPQTQTSTTLHHTWDLQDGLIYGDMRYEPESQGVDLWNPGSKFTGVV